MKTYKLEYTLGIGQQKILASLARRCRLINGWDEQELLQYAANANARADMEIKLQFLEDAVTHLENETSINALKEHLRITDEEHAKCQKVAAAFTELYSIDLLVLDAGCYGFVKLQYYHHPFGYDETDMFTTAEDLFEDLWKEWLSNRLLALVHGTPLADLDYSDIFQNLPEDRQKELLDKKDYFLAKSGIHLRQLS